MRGIPLTLAALILLGGVAAGGDLVLTDGGILTGLGLKRVERGYEIRFGNGIVTVWKELVETAAIEGEDGYAGAHARIEEMAKARHWRHRRRLKTRHFTIEHNVADHVLARYRRGMDAFFLDRCAEWEVSPPTEPLTVRLYRNRKDLEVIGGVSGGTTGFYRSVPPPALDFCHDGDVPARSARTLRFLLTLHVLRLRSPDLPPFPRLALADLASAGEAIGGFAERLRHEPAPALRDLFLAWSDLPHRPWGWALARFLTGDERFAKPFRAYSRAAGPGSGEENFARFRAALGLTDDAAVADLESRWRAQAKSLPLGEEPQVLDAAESAWLEGRRSRARELYAAAVEKGTTSAVAHRRLGRLVAGTGRLPEAIRHLMRARDLDPLSEETWDALGDALKRRGVKREGERCIRLAREIRDL